MRHLRLGPRAAVAMAAMALLLATPAAATAAPSVLHGIGSPGTARLQVEGDGLVNLRGTLVAFGLLPEATTIWVNDVGGDARFVLDGRQPRLREGRVTRFRGSGRFYLSGSDVRVQLRGDDLSISAAGRGRVRLRGEGEYRLNDAPARSWPGGRGRAATVAIVTDPPEQG